MGKILRKLSFTAVITANIFIFTGCESIDLPLTVDENVIPPYDHIEFYGDVRHKAGLQNPEVYCISCHGLKLEGNKGPSCYSCHKAIWGKMRL